jgi:hypothetical protein
VPEEFGSELSIFCCAVSSPFIIAKVIPACFRKALRPLVQEFITTRIQKD